MASQVLSAKSPEAQQMCSVFFRRMGRASLVARQQISDISVMNETVGPMDVVR